jgi:hypothetical protein
VAMLICLIVAAQPTQAVTVSPPVQVGTVSSSTLSELSGLVGSRSLPNTLWVHNDSGDTARFFAINTSGTLLGAFPLSGATNVDWEDIAIGPKPGGGNYLYLGDIGDNNSVRSQISVYRVDEPQIATGAIIPSNQYTKVSFQYPNGPRDAESLMVDPRSGDMFVISKQSTPHVYRAPAGVFNNPAQVTTLEALGNLAVSLDKPSAADISPDGAHILVRDRSTTAYLFERGTNQSVWDALQGPGIPVTLASEAQGEAIGWAADGSGFYTASEWNGLGPQPVYFYSFVVPEPASWQLMLSAFFLALVVRCGAAPRRASAKTR